MLKIRSYLTQDLLLPSSAKSWTDSVATNIASFMTDVIRAIVAFITTTHVHTPCQTVNAHA